MQGAWGGEAGTGKCDSVPCIGDAELCQGNLIPMHADKMVPTAAAQIT